MSHDLPSRLAVIAERSGGLLGDAREVALARTIVGHYLRFRPSAERESVLTSVVHGDASTLKLKMGWPATRFGAAHPLRACDRCIEEDRTASRVAAWRLIHQPPAVWVCPIHGTPLWAARAKVNGTRRFDWLLPDDIDPAMRDVGALTGASPTAVGAAVSIANDTAAILGLPTEWFIDRRVEAAVLRARLIDCGYARSGGRLRPDSIGRALQEHCNRFSELPESPALALGGEAALAMLRRLLDPEGRPMHPLRHLTVIQWLFESWPKFLFEYDRASGGYPAKLPKNSPVKTADAPSEAVGARTTFALLVQQHGLSASTAAQRVGISVNTGLQWAALLGLQMKRRPKVINDAIRMGIENSLREGIGKLDIASRHAISVETVTRILLSTVGLRAERNETLLTHRRSAVRRNLTSFVSSNPKKGALEVRTACQADYVWASRHDVDWFQTWRSGLCTVSRPSTTRVNWAARDQVFSALVEKAIKASLENGINSKSVGQIVRDVPGLRQKLRHLEKMPKTCEGLTAAVKPIDTKGSRAPE